MPLAAPASPVEVARREAGGGEAAAIRDALARSGGNVVRAARLLGLGRNALRHRMRRLGIERPPVEGQAAAPARDGAPLAPEVAAGAASRAGSCAPWRSSPSISWRRTTRVEPWTVLQRWETKLDGAGRGVRGASSWRDRRRA